MPAPYRIDWAQIKSKWLADDHRILVLDQRAINFLLGVMPRLHWAATFDHDDLAATDWDYIQRIVSDAEESLGTAMKVSDLLPYIDDIENLLRALNSTAGCCGPVDVTNGDQYTDPVTDGEGDVPQNIIDAGYASGTSDWSGFDDYKCMISHVMVYNLEQLLRDLLPHFDETGQIIGGVGTVAAIIGTVLAAAATGGVSIILEVIASVGLAAAVWSFITGIGESVTEDVADQVAFYHDDLACAIYNADGSQGAVDDLKAKIDQLFPAATAAGLKQFSLDATLKALYAGRYDQTDVAQNLADAGFDVGDYTCSCDTIPESACDAGNQIYDCGFESGDWGHWQQNIDPTGATFTAGGAYEGTYKMLGANTGSGVYTHWIYQDFYATATGDIRVYIWQYFITGSYNNAIRLYHWNGSSWDQVGSQYACTTPHVGSWQLFNQLTDWSVTSGQLYQVRMYHRYQYSDNVKLVVE